MSKLEIDWQLNKDGKFQYYRYYSKDSCLPDVTTKPKDLIRYYRDDVSANYTLEIDVTKLNKSKQKDLARLTKGSFIEILKGE